MNVLDDVCLCEFVVMWKVRDCIDWEYVKFLDVEVFVCGVYMFVGYLSR